MAADVDLGDTLKASELFPLQVLMFHRLHNTAIVIEHDTNFVIGLEDYARQKFLERQISVLAQAAFLNGFIQRCLEEVRALIADADTPEKRLEALPKAQELQEQVEQARKKLKALENG